MTYASADGEEGYPGALQVSVTYTLSEDGAFAIHYEAVTTKDTVVNLTNHMNFDVAGAGSPDGVLGQILTVDADRYLPLDKSQIPLGQLAPVSATPFDFRKPTAIGEHIHDKNGQLAIANGYDQYWVPNKRGGGALKQVAARAYDPRSGRTLECLTTEPGAQIYTADWFDGSYAGVGGRYGQYAAFTLETQHFPDSPNHPGFPSTELKPGQVFRSTTIFRFGVQEWLGVNPQQGDPNAPSPAWKRAGRGAPGFFRCPSACPRRHGTPARSSPRSCRRKRTGCRG